MGLTKLIFTLDDKETKRINENVKNENRVYPYTNKIFLMQYDDMMIDFFYKDFFNVNKWNKNEINMYNNEVDIADIVSDESLIPTLSKSRYYVSFGSGEEGTALIFLSSKMDVISVKQIEPDNKSLKAFYDAGIKYIQNYINMLTSEPKKYAAIYVSNYNIFYNLATVLFGIGKCLQIEMSKMLYLIISFGKVGVLDHMLVSIMQLNVPDVIVTKMNEMNINEMMNIKFVLANKDIEKKDYIEFNLDKLPEKFTGDNSNKNLIKSQVSMSFFSILGRKINVTLPNMVINNETRSNKNGSKQRNDIEVTDIQCLNW